MWFTETPWPPILIGLILAVILWMGWSAQRRAMYLVAAVGCLLACAAIYIVEQMIVTDSEVVEQQVLDLADAVRRDDAEAAGSYFDNSLSSVPYRIAVSGAMALYDIQDDMRITDLRVRMEEDGQAAVSHFRANATVKVKSSGGEYRGATRWELTWRRNPEGQWKIAEIQRLHPISGKEIGFLDNSEH